MEAVVVGWKKHWIPGYRFANFNKVVKKFGFSTETRKHGEILPLMSTKVTRKWLTNKMFVFNKEI